MDKIELDTVRDFDIYGALIADKLSNPEYLQVNIEVFLDSLLSKLRDKIGSA
jgi:hypothetical protein